MIPKRSPFGLIQEDLFPNEWLILVSCMLLNCTSRKQVESVFPTFTSRYPTPQLLLQAPQDEIAALCKPLGFANRRTQNLFKMSYHYLNEVWYHARELPGIGEYGARTWEIFCRNDLGSEPPNDHALVQYYLWAQKNSMNR